MKLTMPVKTFRRNLPAVRLEELPAVLPEKLPVDVQTLRKVSAAAKYFDTKSLKRGLALVAGGAVALSLLGKLIRGGAYHRTVAKELKRQLEPINAKLTRLEEQNEELKKQNEELKKRIKEA